MNLHLFSQTLKRIVRDQAWQFIAAIIGSIGISASFLIFLLQRDTRGLRIEVVSITSLIEVQEIISDEIQILYKNQPVTNLSLVDVTVENIGNRAIREADYVRPIKFIFPTPTEVIETRVLETSPSNIDISIQTTDNVVTLMSTLLNPSDKFTIRFILLNLPHNDSQPFVVDARIAEVSNILVRGLAKENLLNARLTLSVAVIIILVTFASIIGIMLGVRVARPVLRY